MGTAAARVSPPSLARDHEPLPVVQRFFEISLFFLVATGILSLIATRKLDWLTTLVAPAALLVKGLRIRRGCTAELTHRMATALVLGYFMFFPLDLWIFSRYLAAGSPNPLLYAGLLASIHLLIFATLVRLYSSRTTRDYVFLALLAFAAMLASAILTVGTTFLVGLAVFLILAVSSFVGLEIRRSSQGAVSPRLDPSSPAAQRLERALGLASLLVAAGALVLGGMIFFLIPRFTAGYLSALNLQPTMLTGFTDNVVLGEIGKIDESHAVVMRVKVEGDPAAAGDVHWRGAVLTDFDGTRWYTPGSGSVMVTPDVTGAYHLKIPSLPAAYFHPLRYSVLMEPIGTDAIFLAARPVAIWGRFGSDAGSVGRFSRRDYLILSPANTLTNPQHSGAAMSYQALSQIPAIPPQILQRASAEYPQSIRNTYLELPLLDPRIPALARQITRQAKTPYDKAASIELYLKSHFGYTLDLSHMRRQDPLADFLFVTRAGNCEYFASAMTVMLRTLGIPARYVTGFQTGQYNYIAHDYIVRASDAHSWVEVYFPGYGWIPFDPTPGGDASPGGVFAQLGLYWDWFQLNWNEWIINYDFSHQLSLARDIHDSSHALSDHLEAVYKAKQQEIIARMKTWQARMAGSRYSLPGALALLLLLLLYFRGRAMGGFLAVRWGLRAHRHGQLPPELASFEYSKMLHALERQGWRKRPAQTPLEFAASIPEPEFARPVAELTAMYQSARFGARSPDARRMVSLLRWIEQLGHPRKRWGAFRQGQGR